MFSEIFNVIFGLISGIFGNGIFDSIFGLFSGILGF